MSEKQSQYFSVVCPQCLCICVLFQFSCDMPFPNIFLVQLQKEMFLSREELQMSIRGAEDKEIEKQVHVLKR